MKFNVLIAEDEDDVRNLLKSIVGIFFLKKYPFLQLHVDTASNGKEALEIAKEVHHDLILTDIVMPVMDGISFIKEVRTFDKSVPILVLSALSSKDDIDKIMQSGANNYTNKPLNHKLFMAQITVFVDFYLRRQNRYNKKAVNLFSKNIYKRKMEFFVDKEEDLFEFWEFVTNGLFDKCKVGTILHFIYDLELLMIKQGVTNSIILEEDDENFYLTLLELDKINYKAINSLMETKKLKESDYKTDGFFLTLCMYKNEKSTKKKEPKKVVQQNDEYFNLNEFLSELDPSYEEKIERFLNDLNFIAVDIYKLEMANLQEVRGIVKDIVKYIYNFNKIIASLGAFEKISNSFTHLINFLENIDDDVLKNNETRVLLSRMLQGVINDLESWINVIFVEQTANNIHYFDTSFYDDCTLISSVFAPEKV